jgi:cytoskeletal protein RodZ
MDTTREGNLTEATSNSSETTEKRKRKLPLIFFLLFLFILIIIFLVIMYFSKAKMGDTSNKTPTESAQAQVTSTPTTPPATPKVTEKAPSCGPIFTGGTVVSTTSTETTWSYYFSDASKQSVTAYVADLKSAGWSTISEKTIANTTFWDLKKGDCSVALRYHAPDNGVILEMKKGGK